MNSILLLLVIAIILLVFPTIEGISDGAQAQLSGGSSIVSGGGGSSGGTIVPANAPFSNINAYGGGSLSAAGRGTSAGEPRAANNGGNGYQAGESESQLHSPQQRQPQQHRQRYPRDWPRYTQPTPRYPRYYARPQGLLLRWLRALFGGFF